MILITHGTENNCKWIVSFTFLVAHLWRVNELERGRAKELVNGIPKEILKLNYL